MRIPKTLNERGTKSIFSIFLSSVPKMGMPIHDKNFLACFGNVQFKSSTTIDVVLGYNHNDLKRFLYSRFNYVVYDKKYEEKMSIKKIASSTKNSGNVILI
tara:strand:+ start:389 stop:691 length:303 start_codon:yes stop_codon:yes gene_type:complete